MGLIEIVLAGLCLNVTCDYQVENQDASTTFSAKNQNLLRLGQQLSRDTLKITTYQNGELSGYVKEDGGQVKGTGIAFEIVHILQEKYNFNYTIILPKDDIFLTINRKGGAKELLENKTADLAAALLPVINDFRTSITYSKSFDTAEWNVLMNRPTESATGSGLLAPFTTPVWILIILSILIVGPVIYFLIFVQARLCRDDGNPVYPLSTCMWFVYGALLKQGSTLNPRTDSSRLLFSTWWIFILILTAFYTANLTAFLTLSTFTLPISKPEDVGKKHSKWVTNKANGLREMIYSQDKQNIYPKLVDTLGRLNMYPDMDDMNILGEYVTKKDMMFIREKTVIDHIMYEDYKNKVRNGVQEGTRCTFVVTKFSVVQQNRAFAYSKGFKYSELFDMEIQHLIESGIIQYKLRENLPDAEICPLNLKSTERKLRNTDLLLTYIIVGSGIAMAACVFLAEVLWNFCYRKCQKRRKKTRFNPRTHMLSLKSNDNNAPNKLGFPVSLLPMNNNTISPPPTYQSLFNPPFTYNRKDGVKKSINGRDYWIVEKHDGFRQLIPLRTPSALLFQYSN